MNELIHKVNQLHTTELGIVRIKRNLELVTEDAVEWCRLKILQEDAGIKREGKNWYVDVAGCIITVNAYNYCIITAHKKKG